jgi:antitoxin HicB
MNWNPNQNRFSFPIVLTPDLTDGGYVVTFPNLPEAITQGENIEDCLKEAIDCLEEAIALRIDEQLDIPFPSENPSDYWVDLPLQMSLKALLYLSIKESGISYQNLAQSMNIQEKEICENLRPNVPTSLEMLEKILSILGKKLQVNLV